MSAQTLQHAARAQKSSVTPGLVLQRKCACGTHTPSGGQCGECAGKERELLRKATDHHNDPAAVPDIVHDVLRSPGQPLDAATRAYMEPRFGHDFSQVRSYANRNRGVGRGLAVVPETDSSERAADAIAHRIMRSPSSTPRSGLRHDFGDVRIHSDAMAAQSARAMNARAYSVGNHVVFADGQYATSTSSGRELIAHELAHVAGARVGADAVHCKRFEADEAACTATMRYLVQTNFEDYGGDKWDTLSKTRTLGRKKTFRNNFKQSIENAFNGSTFRITPAVNSFESGWIFKESQSCPCAKGGFMPKVAIDLVDLDDWSVTEDWEIEVKANPSGGNIRSSTDQSAGSSELDEADATPHESAPTKAPGVMQVPAVHEFGHFIGLDHPGSGIGAAKPNEQPEYFYQGKDVKNRKVDGLVDLLGVGMSLRSFYFDAWNDELGKKYGGGCGWKIL